MLDQVRGATATLVRRTISFGAGIVILVATFAVPDTFWSAFLYGIAAILFVALIADQRKVLARGIVSRATRWHYVSWTTGFTVIALMFFFHDGPGFLALFVTLMVVVIGTSFLPVRNSDDPR
jgi:hypothetical protein